MEGGGRGVYDLNEVGMKLSHFLFSSALPHSLCVVPGGQSAGLVQGTPVYTAGLS